MSNVRPGSNCEGMPLTRYKMFGLSRRGDRKLSEIEVMTSKSLRGRRVYVKIPGQQDYVIGFRSFDGKGIVYHHPNAMMFRYSFFRVLTYAKIHWNGNHSHGRHINIGTRFTRNLNKAVLQEIEVCKDLEPVFKKVNVYRLPESGIHSGGTDIIITKQEISDSHFEHRGYYEAHAKYWTHNSIMAIEVLGTTIESGKRKFTFPPGKDFLNWANDTINNGSIPVIAWLEGVKVWYVPLFPFTEDFVKHIFWTRHGEVRWGYRQRTNLSPIDKCDKFKMDSRGLYAHLKDYYTI
jgi:hypothetical protein